MFDDHGGSMLRPIGTKWMSGPDRTNLGLFFLLIGSGLLYIIINSIPRTRIIAYPGVNFISLVVTFSILIVQALYCAEMLLNTITQYNNKPGNKCIGVYLVRSNAKRSRGSS